MNDPKLYTIEQEPPSDAFQELWSYAGRHLKSQAREVLRWLRSDLEPPIAEHLSFLLGNQLFFVFVESEDIFYGNLDLFLQAAEAAKAVPCILPMQKIGAEYKPMLYGWGLVHAKTKEPVNPSELVSEELIEISDWELHDFAIHIVKTHLERDGKAVFQTQANMEIDPSIWFEENGENYWVVVRGGRHPTRVVEMPANLAAIKKYCAHRAAGGFFAPVILANSDDPFEPGGKNSLPLYRGHGVFVKYGGLQSV